MSTFNIDRPLLSNILTEIGTGRIQLPDFQRDWRWDEEDDVDLFGMDALLKGSDTPN